MRTEVTGSAVLHPMAFRVPISASHDVREVGLRMIGRNLYYLFCAETSPDLIICEEGIMVSIYYREQ